MSNIFPKIFVFMYLLGIYEPYFICIDQQLTEALHRPHDISP